jgi:quercetin dioxygenase-like cupin family protein
MQALISSQQGPELASRRFVMAPGGGMPNHTNTVEHQQYVLRGQGMVAIGEEAFEVQARNVAFIPEGAAQWYRNFGDENIEFLCIIPNKEDRITLLEKASCQATGPGAVEAHPRHPDMGCSTSKGGGFFKIPDRQLLGC